MTTTSDAGDGQATRVPILVRLPIPTRDGLRDHAALEGTSMCRHLEKLIRRDLDGAAEDSSFVVTKAPTFAAKGHNGVGRPTKGTRATVMLRVGPDLREAIHRRAASLQLTVIDYFESLVSHDISAISPAGEEMTLDQTA